MTIEKGELIGRFMGWTAYEYWDDEGVQRRDVYKEGKLIGSLECVSSEREYHCDRRGYVKVPEHIGRWMDSLW